MKLIDTIRKAISDRFEARKKKLRREGYTARAEEDLAMLDEFRESDEALRDELEL